MFQTILVAFDGSQHAREAARIAGDLARGLGGSAGLWVVIVMGEIPRDLGDPYLDLLIEQRTRVGEAMLAEAETLIGAGLETHRELLFGTPAECIIQVAETRACDLIIMGTRGLGPLQGLLLGSQTQKVISHAHCPVLAVK